MKELEKILEEIDFEIAGSMGKKREGLLEAEGIIRKHMNDGWIPTNRPPETGRRCLVKMKHHAWIADYDSAWVPEEEKTYHAEYIEICEALYHGDGVWSYYDLKTGNDEAFTEPEEDKARPVDEVLEWQYMPHLQPETCKYTGGSCCWPIDQCSDCPNNPERRDAVERESNNL